MSQQENRIADSQFLDWGGASATGDEVDTGGLGAVRSSALDRTLDDDSSSIVRQLNGPLTALLLYMEELKRHSHRLSRETGERDHLQKVVENALLQTERVCALVKQAGGAPMEAALTLPARNAALQGQAERHKESGRCPAAMLSADAGQKPLTKREREVLNLISEGYSNKQGALRMQISPRTFESHRAEAMRKLGARNTADLVRAVLLQPLE